MFKQILKNKGMNMDKEFLRNGEGYVDPTAYEAMKKWEGVKMQLNPGDIINISFPNSDKLTMCFVIKPEKEYIEILIPHKDREYVNQNEIAVSYDLFGVNKTSYADAARLSYISPDRVDSKISELADDERERLFAAIKIALGLADAPEPRYEPPQYPDEDYLFDLENAKTEARIYKEMYEKLLREVVGK